MAFKANDFATFYVIITQLIGATVHIVIYSLDLRCVTPCNINVILLYSREDL